MSRARRKPAEAGRSAARDGAPSSDASEQPTWITLREAVRVVAYRPHLRKTIRIALIVGTILFCINQLNLVIEHKATLVVWLKTALTYLVPFCVSNLGILVATRRAPQQTP